MAQFTEEQGLQVECAIDAKFYVGSWFDVFGVAGLALMIHSLYYLLINHNYNLTTHIVFTYNWSVDMIWYIITYLIHLPWLFVLLTLAR